MPYRKSRHCARAGTGITSRVNTRAPSALHRLSSVLVVAISSMLAYDPSHQNGRPAGVNYIIKYPGAVSRKRAPSLKGARKYWCLRITATSNRLTTAPPNMVPLSLNCLLPHFEIPMMKTETGLSVAAGFNKSFTLGSVLLIRFLKYLDFDAISFSLQCIYPGDL